MTLVCTWEQKLLVLWRFLKPVRVLALDSQSPSCHSHDSHANAKKNYQPPPKRTRQPQWIALVEILQVTFTIWRVGDIGVYLAITYAEKASVLVIVTTSFGTAGNRITSQLYGSMQLIIWLVLGWEDRVCGIHQLWTVFGAFHFSWASDESIRKQKTWEEWRYTTFREPAVAMGLYMDGNGFERSLDEAVRMRTTSPPAK